ncbi:destrin [Solea senegalensis]|uniref:Destrin n=1 Tax=Solea senegalensis TaxID=28829 RepID=A0AAV6S5H1_SOLSE|nr:cofilin-2-like [Solea senegalensis]KAG7512572.1 destrin [Solea senegalensis]
MTSGVKCTDQVTSVYSAMQLTKTDDDPSERPRIVQFNITNGYIDVTKIYRQKEIEGKEDVHKFFGSLFDEEKCCYFLYDCLYETKDTQKKDLVFIMWTPENSKVSDKMQYSSSKQSITKVMKAVKHMFEMQQLSDVRDKEDFADRLGREVIKVEGHALKKCGAFAKGK